MGRQILGQQFGGRDSTMRPAELLPLAGDRLSDPSHKAHVESIAASIQKVGYRAGKHDSHVSKPQQSSHIHVVHTDDSSWVENGNHRVHALSLAGYSKPVPVRVTDLRTKKD